MPPLVSISVVAHNRLDLTRRCLESVFRNTTTVDFELIVTDNASTDGTRECLKHLDPKVVPVFNSKNLGFNRPQNEALSIAKGDFFVALNNDIEIRDGRWIEKLIGAFRSNPKLAVCGPKGGCCTLAPNGDGYRSDRVDYIEGALLMIPRILALEHGLFSPEYTFAYFEDSDLSLRMRWLGYSIAQVEIDFVHDRSSTTKDVIANKSVDIAGHQMRNRGIFLRKWSDWISSGYARKRIVVKRHAARGDVLLTTPILRALRKKNPTAEIIVATGQPDVLANNPAVDSVVDTTSIPKKYDQLIDLDMAYENRPMMHAVDAYAEVAGVHPDGYKPSIFPSKSDFSRISALSEASEKNRQRIAAFFVGPTWASKSWPLEKFNEVASKLRADGWLIACFGAAGSHKVDPCNIDLIGRISIQQSAAAMRFCSLYVGLDSLPMHLAAAMDVPIVGIFGCTSPKFLLPKNVPHMTGVTADVACQGCRHWVWPPTTGIRCPREKLYCVEISTDQVLKAIDAVMESYAKRIL